MRPITVKGHLFGLYLRMQSLGNYMCASRDHGRGNGNACEEGARRSWAPPSDTLPLGICPLPCVGGQPWLPFYRSTICVSWLHFTRTQLVWYRSCGVNTYWHPILSEGETLGGSNCLRALMNHRMGVHTAVYARVGLEELRSGVEIWYEMCICNRSPSSLSCRLEQQPPASCLDHHSLTVLHATLSTDIYRTSSKRSSSPCTTPRSSFADSL